MQVHLGVKGTVRSVKSAGGASLADAVITVQTVDEFRTNLIEHDVFSNSPYGDYYRLLLPDANYRIKVLLLACRIFATSLTFVLVSFYSICACLFLLKNDQTECSIFKFFPLHFSKELLLFQTFSSRQTVL